MYFYVAAPRSAHLEAGALLGVENLHRAVEAPGSDELRVQRMRADRVDVVLAHGELDGRRVLAGAPDLDEPVAAGSDDLLGERVDLEVPDESVVRSDALQRVGCGLAVPHEERVAGGEGDGGGGERGDALDGALHALLAVGEEGWQRRAADVFEQRHDAHRAGRAGTRLRGLVAVRLLEQRDQPVGGHLRGRRPASGRVFRGSRSRRRTRGTARRRGFRASAECPASARSRGSYERSGGRREGESGTLRERR